MAGAALWIVDYVLQAVMNGVDRLYFHQGTIGNCVSLYVLSFTPAALTRQLLLGDHVDLTGILLLGNLVGFCAILWRGVRLGIPRHRRCADCHVGQWDIRVGCICGLFTDEHAASPVGDQ